MVSETKPSASALVDWDGPGDPGNPRNWSLVTKIYATAVPAMYAFAVYVFSLMLALFLCVDKTQDIRHLCIYSRYSSNNGAVSCEPDGCYTWVIALL